MRLTPSPVRRRPDRGGSDRRRHPGPVTLPRGAADRACPTSSRASRPSTDTPVTPRMSSLYAGGRTSLRRTLVVLTGMVVVLVFASASAAYADSHHDVVVLAIVATVSEVLTNIRNWLMGILAGLATVFLTIGGVRRVFGAGDPGEQEKAKEAFKAAGIGYGLAALAPLIVAVLQGIVGA